MFYQNHVIIKTEKNLKKKIQSKVKGKKTVKENNRKACNICFCSKKAVLLTRSCVHLPCLNTFFYS